MLAANMPIAAWRASTIAAHTSLFWSRVAAFVQTEDRWYHRHDQPLDPRGAAVRSSILLPALMTPPGEALFMSADATEKLVNRCASEAGPGPSGKTSLGQPCLRQPPTWHTYLRSAGERRREMRRLQTFVRDAAEEPPASSSVRWMRTGRHGQHTSLRAVSRLFFQVHVAECSAELNTVVVLETPISSKVAMLTQ